MQKFEITVTNDGQYQLLELRPVLIGIFPEQATAETVRDLLDAASRDEEDAAPALPTVMTPSVLAVKTVEVENKPTPKQDTPDFSAAVERIENGEKIADVAKDIGVAFTGMRAAWANHCRQKKAAAREADPGHSRASLPPCAKEPCVLCGREFTPSASSPDKCARCAADFQ